MHTLCTVSQSHWDLGECGLPHLVEHIREAMAEKGVNDAVQRALAKAAALVNRHALLDSARISMERALGYHLPPEYLPWGSSLSMSYLLQSCKYTDLHCMCWC